MYVYRDIQIEYPLVNMQAYKHACADGWVVGRWVGGQAGGCMGGWVKTDLLAVNSTFQLLGFL